MLIKNTNPNKLLAEFKRDKHFCPYNEEELERLKKEGERLRKEVTCNISIWHNKTYISYGLLRIADNEVRYEYEEYGRICKISSVYPLEQTEYVCFGNFGRIVFFFRFASSDGIVDWSTEVIRDGVLNQQVSLRINEEVKFESIL